MFHITIIKSNGLYYYGVLHGQTLVHTCMSDAGARLFIKRQEQKIQATQRQGGAV